MKTGKLGWMPWVLGWPWGRSVKRSAIPIVTEPSANKIVAGLGEPETPNKTPVMASNKATRNQRTLGLPIARKDGNQRAENPHTTGTTNPQPSSTRYFWSSE